MKLAELRYQNTCISCGVVVQKLYVCASRHHVHHCPKKVYHPLSQVIYRFGFLKYIVFAMHLDMIFSRFIIKNYMYQSNP